MLQGLILLFQSSSDTIKAVRNVVEKAAAAKEEKLKAKKEKRGAYKFYELKSGKCSNKPDENTVVTGRGELTKLCNKKNKDVSNSREIRYQSYIRFLPLQGEFTMINQYINICEHDIVEREDSDEVDHIYVKKEMQCKIKIANA